MTLPNYEEAGFYAIAGNAVPHHARLATGDGVAEIHHLSGVEGGIGMHGAKAAGAVIHQLSDNLLRRGILEEEFQGTLCIVASFGAAIGV